MLRNKDVLKLAMNSLIFWKRHFFINLLAFVHLYSWRMVLELITTIGCSYPNWCSTCGVLDIALDVGEVVVDSSHCSKFHDNDILRLIIGSRKTKERRCCEGTVTVYSNRSGITVKASPHLDSKHNIQCFTVVFIDCLLYRVDCYWEVAFCRWDYHRTLHDRVLYPRSTKRTPTHLLRLNPLCSGRCRGIVPVFRFYHIGFSLCTEKTKTNCKVCLKHFTCKRGFV